MQNAILNGEININEGAITENAVADLVFKNGHKLHYYDVKGRLEIDFILNIENSVIPVEVKSGPDYKHHFSLSKVLSNTNLNIKSAVVLCNANIQIENNITYYPLYMAMFL